MFAKAAGPLSKACELEARNFRSHYNLGLVLIELQRYQDAAAPLERAHQLSPEQPDPLARLAYADLRAGRIVAARAAIAKLLKLPGDPQSLLLTALRTTNMARRYDETLRLARDQAAKPDSVEVRGGGARFRVVVGYVTNKAAAEEVVAQIGASNGKAIAVKCDVGMSRTSSRCSRPPTSSGCSVRWSTMRE